MTRTLDDAKREVKENMHTGCSCPCCSQYVRMYKRKLTSAMGYGLIRMYRKHNLDWFHAENSMKEMQDLPSSIRGDFTKLRHWGLLAKSQKNDDHTKKDNGVYKITPKGADFIHGLIKTESHVLLYNGSSYGLTGDKTSMVGVLGSKFSYKELMSEVSDLSHGE